MRRFRLRTTAGGLLLALSTAFSAPAADMRLITIGAPVTELAFAVGGGVAVVGRDMVSRYPAAALARPDIGYMRSLSAEGLMSLAPTHVLAMAGAGPESTFDQLRAMGVAVVALADATDRAGLFANITTVARVLGQEPAGQRLASAIDRTLTDLAAAVARARAARVPGSGARVLCLVGAGPGGMMAAGSGTVPDALITMAGAANVMADHRNYPSLSAESALAVEPDILLVGQSLIARSGGMDALLALPQLAMTPAARERRVVVVDGGLLVGFGPRVGEVVAALAREQKIEGIP